MKFRSTRRGGAAMSFSDAIRQGLAADGGLFVPEAFPSFSAADFPKGGTLPEVATLFLAPFLRGDRLEGEIEAICRDAFAFAAPVIPAPLRETGDDGAAVLELFHGPTAAFKDFGARFLAVSLSRLGEGGTVLVATSGDTGGAVAAAFHGRPGFQVWILYPRGKVSARQEKQLACWGGNVRAFAVAGDFDDCQRIAKEAFSDPAFRGRHRLFSANSINVGRLLPQSAYYARAALEAFAIDGAAPGFIVPSGNLGNAVAAVWARKCGMPVRSVVLATNANRAVADFFAGRDWKPLPTVATLANAMDVGNPSNMERLLDLYADAASLRGDLHAVSVSDEEIRRAIGDWDSRRGRVLCPHTAAAAVAFESLPTSLRDGKWILAATAHPAKFESIVEPLIGREVPVPPELAKLLSREPEITRIPPSLEALRAAV